MLARVVTFTGAKDIDRGLEFLQGTVAPLLRQQGGWTGTTASADRANGVFSVLTTWATQADREASEDPMRQVRAQAQDIVGGELSVDYFEQVVFDLAQPPRIGARLLLRPFSMALTTVEDNIEFFKAEVLPRIKTGSGYLALRELVNRENGHCMVGSLWDSDDALEAAAQAAEERRSMGEQRGITFGDLDRRETVFADLP
jgi:heme-degrading monooxygenase HmoA